MLHKNPLTDSFRPLTPDTQPECSLGEMVASGAYQVVLGLEAAYNVISEKFRR